MSGSRDAERLPWRPVSENALQPQHRDVWVRFGGQWLKGWIVYWERDEDGWRVWMHHELPVEAEWTDHRWFRYDPETIRQRKDDEDPPAP